MNFFQITTRVNERGDGKEREKDSQVVKTCSCSLHLVFFLLLFKCLEGDEFREQNERDKVSTRKYLLALLNVMLQFFLLFFLFIFPHKNLHFQPFRVKFYKFIFSHNFSIKKSFVKAISYLRTQHERSESKLGLSL